KEPSLIEVMTLGNICAEGHDTLVLRLAVGRRVNSWVLQSQNWLIRKTHATSRRWLRGLMCRKWVRSFFMWEQIENVGGRVKRLQFAAGNRRDRPRRSLFLNCPRRHTFQEVTLNREEKKKFRARSSGAEWR